MLYVEYGIYCWMAETTLNENSDLFIAQIDVYGIS